MYKKKLGENTFQMSLEEHSFNAKKLQCAGITAAMSVSIAKQRLWNSTRSPSLSTHSIEDTKRKQWNI